MFRGNQISHPVRKVEIKILNIQDSAATERLRLIAPVLQYIREAPDTPMITALLLQFYCLSHCTRGESPQKSPGKELQVTSTSNCCNITFKTNNTPTSHASVSWCLRNSNYVWKCMTCGHNFWTNMCKLHSPKPYCHNISTPYSSPDVKFSTQFPVPSHKEAKQELATHVITSPDEESPEHEDFQALCTLLLLIHPYQNHPQYTKLLGPITSSSSLLRAAIECPRLRAGNYHWRVNSMIFSCFTNPVGADRNSSFMLVTQFASSSMCIPHKVHQSL